MRRVAASPRHAWAVGYRADTGPPRRHRLSRRGGLDPRHAVPPGADRARRPASRRLVDPVDPRRIDGAPRHPRAIGAGALLGLVAPHADGQPRGLRRGGPDQLLSPVLGRQPAGLWLDRRGHGPGKRRRSPSISPCCRRRSVSPPRLRAAPRLGALGPPDRGRRRRPARVALARLTLACLSSASASRSVSRRATSGCRSSIPKRRSRPPRS